MVKSRYAGFRIELDEVEKIIREFPGIKDATVQAFDEDGGGKFIAAYIVSDQTIDTKPSTVSSWMRSLLTWCLPRRCRSRLTPLNQNQKVNKRALPKPEKRQCTASSEPSNVPTNVLEQQLHQIIADITGTTDFGITTILELCGPYLHLGDQTAVQVNKRYGVTLDSRALVKAAASRVSKTRF